MGILHRSLITGWLACAVPADVAAADVVVRPTKDPTEFAIRFNGEVVIGDAAQLAAVLDRLEATRPPCGGVPCPLAYIEMNSPGGILSEGLRIGYVLRQRHIRTIVRAGQSCLSACALAFLGGARTGSTGGTGPDRSIETGARLGFHSFYLPRNAADEIGRSGSGVLTGMDGAKLVTSLLIAYAVDMGIDPKLIGRILPTKQDQFVFVQTVEDLLDLNINVLDLPNLKEIRADHAVNACNHYTDWRRPLSVSGDKGDRAKVVKLSPETARTTILSHLVGTPSKSRLFAEIRNALNARDNRRLKEYYSELQDLGLPLIDVDRGTTFHVSGWVVVGAGFYVIACIWNASDQNSHDMLLLRTVGISGPFTGRPTWNKVLFLFDQHQRFADIRP